MKRILALTLTFIATLQLVAADGPGSDFTAHEWGTFTSLQGADGVQFSWRPGVGIDLPDFVHTYLKSGNSDSGQTSSYLMSKGLQSAKQRMETPVIYFYSKTAREVDVLVEFPEGLITEWFPRVTSFGPTMGMGPAKKTESEQGKDPAYAVFTDNTKGYKKSYIEWKGVEILAAEAEATFPVIKDSRVNHYYAARETTANPLKYSGPKDSKFGTEQEKLLFYRGLGRFDAPLKVTMDDEGRTLTLENTGKSPLTHLHVYSAHSDKGAYIKIPSILAGQAREVPMSELADAQPLEAMAEEFAASLREGLTSEGLFAEESQAMINTWRDVWFGETGLRVLYVLPRDWTDETLPLTINPAPNKIERVMVGRAEVIPPAVRTQLSKLIDQFGTFPNDPANIVAEVKSLQLGRFVEPFLLHAYETDKTKERKSAVNKLIQALRPPATPVGAE